VASQRLVPLVREPGHFEPGFLHSGNVVNERSSQIRHGEEDGSTPGHNDRLPNHHAEEKKCGRADDDEERGALGDELHELFG
jgi:hypothetical protein